MYMLSSSPVVHTHLKFKLGPGCTRLGTFLAHGLCINLTIFPMSGSLWMVIEWREEWLNWQTVLIPVSETCNVFVIQLHVGMQDNKSMTDAINKRKSDIEPNAIQMGGFPYSTCFFLCSIFLRNQKLFHGLASPVVSARECFWVHTGESSQLYNSQ